MNVNVAAAPRAMPASMPVAPSGAPQQQGVWPSTPSPTAPSPTAVPPSGGGMAVATTVPLGVPSPATGVPMAIGQGFSPASVGVTLGSLPLTTAATAPSVGTSTLSHVPSGLAPMAAPLSVASTGVISSMPIDPAAAAAAVAAAAAAVGTPPMRSVDSVQVRTIPRLPYDVYCYVARLCVLAVPHCCSNGLTTPIGTLCFAVLFVIPPVPYKSNILKNLLFYTLKFYFYFTPTSYYQIMSP